jgi:hypothetical protein
MRIRITDAYQTSVTLYGAYPFNNRRMAAQPLTVPASRMARLSNKPARLRASAVATWSGFGDAAGGRAGAQAD